MRVGFTVRTTLICVAWFATLAAAAWHEFPRLMDAANSPAGVFGWIFSMDADWSLPILVLLSLPVILLIARVEKSKSATGRSIPIMPRLHGGSQRLQPVAAIAVFSLSLISSAAIGFRSISLIPIPGQENATARVRFYELPPAYHDEFSYVLQARTYLAGRLSWPAMNVQPDLFHQVHVLNRPTTASRYFPWTGFWMAPFVAMGFPYFGHWLAGAIACVFFYRCLWRLMGPGWAFVGGVLMALSPGLASFSNLLLAHHPTMMVLAVFLWAFLRIMDEFNVRDAVIAGIALSLAMLSRPMTAAGFALPFGIWLLAAMIRQQSRRHCRGRRLNPHCRNGRRCRYSQELVSPCCWDSACSPS
ncbi:MAG: glycosyltransferase family 39 protein [Planctomycetota bacterium]|nr:glycosyltransferase family 39 protein [Planctomycetota bacterium]